MSLWYDIKHKSYASDTKSSWIRSYVDKVASKLRGETDSTFRSHFSGSLGKHSANDIECDDGNTLQQNLENETAERLAADASAHSEILAESTSIRTEIAAETTERENGDASLLTKINQETSARNAALALKSDKEDEERLFGLYNSLIPRPPELTPVSPDGTVVGSANWTGTGWLYIDTNTKYILHDDHYESSDAYGFARICLKPSGQLSEFWNWTPTYSYNNTVYQFFYAPSRKLYETLIPDIDVPFEDILANIVWENKPPVKLYYGSASGILKYEESTSGGSRYFCAAFPNLEDLQFNAWPTANDGLVSRLYVHESYDSESFAALDINARILLNLILDASCNTYPDEYNIIERKCNGTLLQLPVEVIDNGFPGL